MTRYKGRQSADPVTIASVRAHGVRTLLVYCRGRSEGDWPCHLSGKLAIDRFQDQEALVDIECHCFQNEDGGSDGKSDTPPRSHMSTYSHA